MDEKSNEDLLKLVTAQYNRVFEEMRKVEDQLFRQILANTPSKIDEWIKLSDRLPELYDYVLVCAAFKGTDEPQPIAIARREKEGWRFLNDCRGNYCWAWDIDYGMEGDDITHWMPLPKPPEGE
jgi:hypothetical protein